jgi:hypothetical protein
MPRGGKRAGAGRKKGSTNKLTREAKDFLNARLERNLGHLEYLAHRAKSEGVQMQSLRELVNHALGRARPAEQEAVPPVPTVRFYRWARTPEEATYDPARARIEAEAATSGQAKPVA